ncbi:MAG: Fur family transcriptional regulator [Pseudomonadota bacterium]
MSRSGETWQADVLDIMLQRSSPLSAYDILRELRHANPKIAPPTVYRALAALIKRGRIHRLESLNAYVACRRDCTKHGAILSICDACGMVEECVEPDLLADLSTITGKSGFAAQRHVIEVHGVCASCGREAAST